MVSAIPAGQAGRVVENFSEGKEITAGLGRPQDMVSDALCGVFGYGTGKGVAYLGGKFLGSDYWKRFVRSTAQGEAAGANKTQGDPRKFTDYIFKDGADHGKDKVFRGMGYGKEHSEDLLGIWRKQAADKYNRGNYVLDKADEFGQRINIEIELPGIGDAAGKTSYLKSGWMIQPDGTINLITPFSGFTR